jgi:hypothetical protein
MDEYTKEDLSELESELKQVATQNTDELIEEIFTYVMDNYPLQEFELFKTYIKLKPNMSYKLLSKATKIAETTISSIISKIKADINNNQELKEKRKELIK